MKPLPCKQPSAQPPTGTLHREKFRRAFCLGIALFSGFVLFAPSASARTPRPSATPTPTPTPLPTPTPSSIYSSGKAQVNTGYLPSTKEFTPNWTVEINATVNGVPLAVGTEYNPNNLIAQISSTRTSPSGLETAIGVPDGANIFVAGSSIYEPELVFGAKSLLPSDWSGDIEVTLASWTMPSGAVFAMYATDDSGLGVSERIFSSLNPALTRAANSFQLTPGTQRAVQWGFTHTGNYTLNLLWSGNHATDGPIETPATFTFNVVPEPTPIVLFYLGLAVAIVIIKLRRRQRS